MMNEARRDNKIPNIKTNSSEPPPPPNSADIRKNKPTFTRTTAKNIDEYFPMVIIPFELILSKEFTPL